MWLLWRHRDEAESVHPLVQRCLEVPRVGKDPGPCRGLLRWVERRINCLYPSEQPSSTPRLPCPWLRNHRVTVYNELCCSSSLPVLCSPAWRERICLSEPPGTVQPPFSQQPEGMLRSGTCVVAQPPLAHGDGGLVSRRTGSRIPGVLPVFGAGGRLQMAGGTVRGSFWFRNDKFTFVGS